MSRQAAHVQESTIFWWHFLAIAIDEAHGFRNVNKLYKSVRALRERADLLVAMTATPVQTRSMHQEMFTRLKLL